MKKEEIERTVAARDRSVARGLSKIPTIENLEERLRERRVFYVSGGIMDEHQFAIWERYARGWWRLMNKWVGMSFEEKAATATGMGDEWLMDDDASFEDEVLAIKMRQAAKSQAQRRRQGNRIAPYGDPLIDEKVIKAKQKNPQKSAGQIAIDLGLDARRVQRILKKYRDTCR
jgi:hypothetical protein